ncbi:LysR family transcriptional regulator [Pseudomonas chlororaphis subsp. aurantiaca]|nr:LysR family transcriptional regulator [Pseudomonas chlororaphis subsp. aurantiaca]
MLDWGNPGSPMPKGIGTSSADLVVSRIAIDCSDARARLRKSVFWRRGLRRLGIMDKLIQYRIFIQVSEMGSFIKAAHMLELPRASVSAAIQELETDLGVRLLHRTTRRVQLTADGTQLQERVRRLLTDADDIQRLFQLHQHQVSGRLNIDVPSRIARRLIAPALPTLKRSYPGLQLAFGSTDRSIDLVQEGVDCAVRIGHLLDSSLIARTIGQIALINCAPLTIFASMAPRGSRETWPMGISR